MPTNRIKAECVTPSSLNQIRCIEGQEIIQESFNDYLTDEARFGKGQANHLFYARTEADVVAIMKWANKTQTPLTISAGRTGLTGGAVPLDGALLTLEQMDKLLALGYDENDKSWYLRAQPGVTLEALNTAVRKKQLDSLKGQGSSTEQRALERFLSTPTTYFFPPDPTEMTAHLGGAIAANASGARSFRYGAIRKWIRRLRVVLPNGDLLEIQRGVVLAKDGQFLIELTDGSIREIRIPEYTMPATKNAAGLFSKPEMDFIDLFIGSEGILGVITEAEVQLHEYPTNSLSVFAFFPSEESAIAFVNAIRSSDSPVHPTLVEYFDTHAVAMLREARAKGTGAVTVPPQVDRCQSIIFFEVPFVEVEMEHTIRVTQELLAQYDIGMEGTWAGIDSADLEKMKAVRHLIPETVNSLIAQRKQQYPTVHKLGTDMAVPDEHLETLLAYYKELLDLAGLEYIIFGHIGDNHLHVNILPRTDTEVEQGMKIYQRFAQRAVELGGTVSAEHGIGKLKRPFLHIMYGDEGFSQIARVKSALDPHWILNRGNMIPKPGEPIELI